MLIINADDYGKTSLTSQNILKCYEKGSITSTTALMFMSQSERSAKLAINRGLKVGLHINFTRSFETLPERSALWTRQRRIRSFLGKNKYLSVLYNPLLRRDFRSVFGAQYDEFLRLYRTTPTHFDGHHHMHMCANMLLDKIIPVGSRVRRNFTFRPQEKSFLNRLYRRMTDVLLLRSYVSTDYFFCIHPGRERSRLEHAVGLASSFHVEIAVHPEIPEEQTGLLDESFRSLVSRVRRGSYQDLGA